jgi:hypothetical protein
MHGALRQRGSAVPRGDPGREADLARRSEACHPAGQGLERSTIHPLVMLTSHLPQRVGETRRAFQVHPPWKTVVPKSVYSDLRRVGGHALRLSVSQGGIYVGMSAVTPGVESPTPKPAQ